MALLTAHLITRQSRLSYGWKVSPVSHPGPGEHELPQLGQVVLGAELVAEQPHRAVSVRVDADLLHITVQRACRHGVSTINMDTQLGPYLKIFQAHICRKEISVELTEPLSGKHH